MRIEDITNISFGIIMLFLTVTHLTKINHAYIHLIVELTAIAITLFASKSKNGFVRDWYSLILVPMYFMNLNGLIEAVNPVCYDRLLFEIDKALFFGKDPFKMIEKIYNPVISEVLQICYALYFFVPVIVGVSLYKTDKNYFRFGLLTILVTFYLSYLGYFLVPAVGPRFLLSNNHEILYGIALTKGIKQILDTLEPTKFDCFPSGHVAVSVASLYLARKNKKTFLMLLPIVTGIVMATVYHRYHWIADVIAGFLLFIISLVISNLLFYRFDGWLTKKA